MLAGNPLPVIVIVVTIGPLAGFKVILEPPVTAKLAAACALAAVGKAARTIYVTGGTEETVRVVEKLPVGDVVTDFVGSPML